MLCNPWPDSEGRERYHTNKPTADIFSPPESMSLPGVSDSPSLSPLFLQGPTLPWIKSYLYQKLFWCPQPSLSALCCLINLVFVWDLLLRNHAHENIPLWKTLVGCVWQQPQCECFSGCHYGWLVREDVERVQGTGENWEESEKIKTNKNIKPAVLCRNHIRLMWNGESWEQ